MSNMEFLSLIGGPIQIHRGENKEITKRHIRRHTRSDRVSPRWVCKWENAKGIFFFMRQEIKRIMSSFTPKFKCSVSQSNYMCNPVNKVPGTGEQLLSYHTNLADCAAQCSSQKPLLACASQISTQVQADYRKIFTGGRTSQNCSVPNTCQTALKKYKCDMGIQVQPRCENITTINKKKGSSCGFTVTDARNSQTQYVVSANINNGVATFKNVNQ